MTPAARPHPRLMLSAARRIASRPKYHTPNEVSDALEMLIHFGTVHDFTLANQLRAAIARGEVVPGAFMARMRRLIRMAVLACILVWIIAGGLAAIANAQEAGVLPSIQEVIASAIPRTEP